LESRNLEKQLPTAGVIKAQAGERNNGGGDQDVSAPIDRGRWSAAHRKSLERAKFSKKKITEVRSGSYWHRRQSRPFVSFKRPAKTLGWTKSSQQEKGIADQGLSNHSGMQ
jgi:hypothetical protein